VDVILSLLRLPFFFYPERKVSQESEHQVELSLIFVTEKLFRGKLSSAH